MYVDIVFMVFVGVWFKNLSGMILFIIFKQERLLS